MVREHNSIPWFLTMLLGLVYTCLTRVSIQVFDLSILWNNSMILAQNEVSRCLCPRPSVKDLTRILEVNWRVYVTKVCYIFPKLYYLHSCIYQLAFSGLQLAGFYWFRELGNIFTTSHFSYFASLNSTLSFALSLSIVLNFLRQKQV